MYEYQVRQLEKPEFPSLLHEIPQPPKQLFVVGNLPKTGMKLLAVVGSRKYTTYGKQVIEKLLGGLSGYNIGIVSGLALGVDALAHDNAIKNNLYTLAVPGSGLDRQVLYPASNRGLADRILDNGGGLLSELDPNTKAALWTFPQRNRIMAGMCHATLLIEASAKSGTLITARLCADYNRELLAVPGSIFSANSAGTHQFLKLGATLVTESMDILETLQVDTVSKPDEAKPRPALTPLEELVLKNLSEPTDKDTLIRHLNIDITQANIILMQMEMQGLISLTGNTYVKLIP